ncbi:MAG: hypothetical protein IAF08_02840 [Rhizobacter sp.]|nr:hypothetical protein [Chlorobiales bacterium]
MLLFLISAPLRANAIPGGETFPAGHWAYETIEQLVVRGYLTSLNDAAKPYERTDVAKAILETDKSEIDRPTLWLFNKLEQELEDELDWLRDGVFPTSAIRIGLRAEENVTKQSETPLIGRFRGRSRIALYFAEHFVVYNSQVYQQGGAPDVVSNRVYGESSGYTEQSFIAYHSDNFRVKFGRDYLDWGYANSSLIVSNTAGSLDQIFFQFNSPTIRFTYFTAQLDRIPSTYFVSTAPGDSATSQLTSYTNRYFTAERVDFNLFGSKVRLGIWQGVIYGGLDQPIDWRFANPFQIYFGEQYNNSTEVNPIVGADFSFYPYTGINIYGGIAIDDYQADRKELNDLEPTEWAGTLGARTANILRGWEIYGTDASVEFTKVANRTFHQRALFDYQKLTFGRNPLAHVQGTDFESVEFNVSHWFRKFLQVSINVKAVAQGEGGLFKPFTEPWRDTNPDGTNKYTVEGGYTETSPTGVVDRSLALGLRIFYQPTNAFNAELNLTNVSRSNTGNVAGMNTSDFQIFFRVLFEIQPVLSLF